MRLITFIALLITSFHAFADPVHARELDNMLISTSIERSADNSALPVSILSGDELRYKAAATIGDTLKDELGIVNQSFGPGVGQPVIRGQSGPRVQVLQNSLDSLDVASISPDHSNGPEPLLAERIEVLRGPATLLYGSGAIGGIVNVIDGRIPDSVPGQLVTGAVEQRYNSASDGISTVFKLDGGQSRMAWHLDGFMRGNGDVDIPGRAFAEEDGGSEDRLLNSSAHAYSGTAGLSYVGQQGFIGASIHHLENNYGVPPGADGETVRIDQYQTRYDFKAELNDIEGIVETLRAKLSYNDYRHVELEEGEPGTEFNNEGFAGRLELVQRPWAFFDHGVVGLQTKNSTFSAIGEEAIVPRSEIDTVGFFTLQDIHRDDWIYELGLRVEQQWIDTEQNLDVSHTPVSFSTSALWEFTEQDALKLVFSRSERAPDVQELFAYGPHLATESFEIGSADLSEEISHHLELGLHMDRDWFRADINLFYNWVSDYIAQINSGELFDPDAEMLVGSCPADNCLPVFAYQQRDAEFKGFEIQFTVPVWTNDYGRLESQLFSDYVRGEFSDGSDIPRMPPLRWGMELAWEADDWGSALRLTRAEEQDHPGQNETETDGYWLLDLSAQYRIQFEGRTRLMMFAKAQNLLDEDIRQSVSFLRNVSPEAARSAELGVRIEF